MSRFERLLERRPENVRRLLARASRTCLVSPRELYPALAPRGFVLPCFAVGCRHALPGLLRAAAEVDAVIGIQAPPAECAVSGGLTGQTPKELANGLLEAAERLRFEPPLALHAEGVPVGAATPGEIEAARRSIEAFIHAGFTSFRIDAAGRSTEENATWTGDLARPCAEAGLALEATLAGGAGADPTGAAVTAAARALSSGLAAWQSRPQTIWFEEPPAGPAAGGPAAGAPGWPATRALVAALDASGIGVARPL
ncbi:MAG: class II fructose-bisphosphate aldolase, partial [Planctomycetes bacterium]|nr:class II fructose-bisphosphate aldolase [Planctomycetota bacterium]